MRFYADNVVYLQVRHSIYGDRCVIKQIWQKGDNMNPQMMMQLMGALNTFKSNHPKFVSFVERYMRSGFAEGTVIEITVTEPGAEPVTTNMKVQASDLELVESFKNMTP